MSHVRPACTGPYTMWQQRLIVYRLSPDAHTHPLPHLGSQIVLSSLNGFPPADFPLLSFSVAPLGIYLFFGRHHMESRSRLAPPGVRSGSVRGPREVRSGSVRGSRGVRAGSAWGPHGVRAASVRGPFGIRSRGVRGSFGVRSESVRDPKPPQPKKNATPGVVEGGPVAPPSQPADTGSDFREPKFPGTKI